MKENSKINLYLVISVIVLSLILGGVVGYFIGKGKTKVETVTVVEKEIKYFPGKRIVGTIKDLTPIKVEIPSIPDLLVYTDTVVIDSIVYIQKVDSFTVLREFLTRRYYKEVLFDVDTVGKCSVSFEVYKNRANNLSYEFMPIYKEVKESVKEIKKEKFRSLMLGGGLNFSGGINGQVILSEDKFGIGYQYLRMYNQNYHGVGVFYRIGF